MLLSARRGFISKGVIIFLTLVVVSGLGWYARGRGYHASLLRRIAPPQILIRATRPASGATDVPPNAFVAADLLLVNTAHGLDPATLTSEHVRLVHAQNGNEVPATVNTSGAGDALVLVPMEMLAPNSAYRFEVTSGVRDTAGSSIAPFQTSFTTSSDLPTEPLPVAFEQVAMATAAQHVYTALAIGPDARLYAGTFTGEILRHDINPDGTLAQAVAIPTLQAHENGPRLITGIAFDPASTPEQPVLWISHGQLSVNARFELDNASEWTGKITKLFGRNLDHVQDVVVGLPRGIKDHLNNQPVFGPDGALYFSQGSNTAMGSPDAKWGFRPERLLTAAVLRLDPKQVTAPPLDVRTEEGGTYDPFAPDAPLSVYASGIRVAFDLLWHSSGNLYAGVNGSAAGGKTPPATMPLVGAPRLDQATAGPYTGPSVVGLDDALVQPDLLVRIDQLAYYGHPNPLRNEFVLNGGNPTAEVDPFEVPQYPVGTSPDRNWRKPILNFGYNISPNGLIEYRHPGWLKGKILVTRYSGNDDILALSVDSNGNITETFDGIDGFTRFRDPLDLVEGKNGHIYVAEYGGQRLTLLRPTEKSSNRVIRRAITDADAPLSPKQSEDAHWD